MKAMPCLQLRLLDSGVDLFRSTHYYKQLFDETIKALGINPNTEPHLIWIAEMTLVLPLPLPWIQYAQTETTPMYYFNPKTGVIKTRHPLWNRLLDMVHLRRSDKDPASMSLIVNWHTSDRYEEIEAVKHQNIANVELQGHVDRVCKKIAKSVRVWQRRTEAFHQQQRQSLLTLRMSLRSRKRHIQSVIESVSSFQQRCHAAVISECDDYMKELQSSAERLLKTETEIQKRLERCGRQFSHDHYSEALRLLVQQQISSSMAVLGEASRWMDRAREEMRFFSRDQLVLKRKTKAVESTIRPTQKTLERVETIQKDRLQASQIKITKSIKNIRNLKQSVVKMAEIIDNEGFGNFCKEAVMQLEECEITTHQNLWQTEIFLSGNIFGWLVYTATTQKSIFDNK